MTNSMTPPPVPPNSSAKGSPSKPVSTTLSTSSNGYRPSSSSRRSRSGGHSRLMKSRIISRNASCSGVKAKSIGSTFDRMEFRQAQLGMERIFGFVVEPDLDFHADPNALGRDVRDVGGHDRPLFELDVGDDVRNVGRERRMDRLPHDRERKDRTASRRPDPTEVLRKAPGAARAPGQLPVPARVAGLNPELLGESALPVAASLLDDDRRRTRDELGQRVRHQAAPFVSSTVECAAWKPPCPATTHTSASSTWEVEEPRIWRTPSARTFHPTRF